MAQLEKKFFFWLNIGATTWFPVAIDLVHAPKILPNTVIFYSLTLLAPISQNGQIHSNNSFDWDWRLKG